MNIQKVNKIVSRLEKDDFIVIAGAGGFIGGALTRYFINQGFTRIRAIDKKPLVNWYQRLANVESLCMDLSEKRKCHLCCRRGGRGLQPGCGHGWNGFYQALPN